MRRILAALLALALATAPVAAHDKPPTPPPPAKVPVVDRWSGEDKGAHLFAGGALATAATIKWESRAVGFGVGCGAGVAFELLAPGFKSYKDAVVSCLGAAFGTLIGGWHIDANPRGIRARKEF